MNRLFCLATIICIVSVSLADGTVKARKHPPRGVAKPSGGIVEKAYIGNVLRILNSQKLIPADKLSELTQNIRWTSLIPVEILQDDTYMNKSAIEQAQSLLTQPKVGAGVVLVEDTNLPIMLTSPDSRWAILNVSALKIDAPAPERLINRFTKLYWCAVARSLGVGNSGYQGCVLTPFASLNELDRIPVIQPCPEPFNKMIDSAKVYGINTLSIASYRTACEQGWAAQPTNDVQKLIWDEVHAMPTEPIKIKPETKKQDK